MNIDSDIILYGCFCTPCLFGENQAALRTAQGEYTTCYRGCILYTLHSVCGSIAGVSVALATQCNPALVNVAGTLCSRIMVGAYAGAARKDLRTHLGVPEVCDDFSMHLLCSPLAVCQEAQWIRDNGMKENEHISLSYHAPPDQSMHKV
jgi:Cys-rich protein (TIGR01571 family)